MAFAALLACALHPQAVSGQEPARAPARKEARVEGPCAGAEVRSGAAVAFKPLAGDAALPSRFEIKTTLERVRFAMPDESRVEVEPRSQVARLGSVDVALGGVGRGSADHLGIREGEVLVEVPKTARPLSLLLSAHEVLLAPLPGTVLRARVQPPSKAGCGPSVVALGIAVYQGEARFLTRGAWKVILAGQAVEAVGGDAPPTPTPLPAAPAWAVNKGACRRGPGVVADCGIAVVDPGASLTPMSLAWAPAEGAFGYALEVARDTEFRDIVSRLTTGARSASLPLPAGRYHARVMAQSAARVPGLPSATRELRVVRLSLPAGTTARDGAYLLPRARRVELADPAGVEVALGSSGFLRNVPAFGLVKDAPTLVRLRVSGATDYAELRLEPSELLASIAMSPRNAVWPFDTIHVQVRVSERNLPVSPAFQPRLRVLIDTTEIPVTWERRDGAFHGRIDPRVPPGPWVVRVEARDTHDNEIGRAFMEVAGPPPARLALKR